MTTDELKALEEIAKREARIHLSKSAGHEIEDVAQSSILQFLDRTAKTEVKNPGAMVRIIARRCAWKYRTKWEKKRHDYVLHDLGETDAVAREDMVGPGAEFVPPPEDALIAKVESELVECAVDQLDPEDREIARLTYLNQPPLKAPEVAEHLSLAAGTVRNRLVRIRRLLADLLEE